MNDVKGKIGVFDSGFGGLSIMREIVKLMPQYDYVYLGDSARAPYGDRSQDTIYEYTKEGVDFLFGQGAEIIILACNSASSEALRRIQREYLPLKYPSKKVLGVIIPAAEEAVGQSKNKKIGVLGTVATVSSHAFTREIQKLDSSIEVFEVAAPLLVPLVEAGEEGSESAKILVQKYVEEVSLRGIDMLILGCTHYGFLADEIRRAAEGVTVVEEGKLVADKLSTYLVKHAEVADILSQTFNLEFYTTDSAENFDKHGSRFFGQEVRSKQVGLS